MTTLRRDILVKVREVEKLWFTVADASGYLGTSKDYIRGLIRKGRVSFSKVDGLIFLPKREIDKLIEKCKVI